MAGKTKGYREQLGDAQVEISQLFSENKLLQSQIMELRSLLDKSQVLMSDSSALSTTDVFLDVDTEDTEPEENCLEEVKAKKSSSRIKLRRSFSESILLEETEKDTSIRQIFNVEKDPILGREHRLITKTASLRETCDVCLHPIRFMHPLQKCQDCRLRSHDHQGCQQRLPMPCAPRKTGSWTCKAESGRLRLADYCPDYSPMVPYVCVHLVAEIEHEHLTTSKIYSAKPDREIVKGLVDKMKGSRALPRLARFDGLVLAGSLLNFISDFADSIVPQSSYSELIKACDDEKKLLGYIAELPIPNHETLQFLCKHWQNVVKQSEQNYMTLSRLASAVAPSVFGFSNLPPKIKEEGLDKCCRCMEAILNLSSEAWDSSFESRVRPSSSNQRIPITPRRPVGSSFTHRTDTPRPNGTK